MTARHIRSDLYMLVLMLGPGLASAGAYAQTLEKGHICPVIEANTPANSEFCIANRSPNPADSSLVIVSRSGTSQQVFLIRLDQPRGGNCAPITSDPRAYLCVKLEYEAPPNYNAICDFQAPYFWSCADGRTGKYYNSASNVVTPGPGGVHPVPTERFYEATRGLEIGDFSVEELGNVLVYRGQLASDGIPLRLRTSTEATPTMKVREPAAQTIALRVALDRATAEGVKLEDLRALGTDGRFIAETAGILRFYGTATDCEGQCVGRPLLNQTDFESRLAGLGAVVPIERLVGRDLVKVRAQLIGRLLLGSIPLPGIDSDIEAMRIVQPVAFLILNWS